MAKVPVDFLIGFLLGCVFSMGYYDGVVAKEYKDKIERASSGLKRADKVIESKNMEIRVILKEMEEMKAYNARVFKNI